MPKFFKIQDDVEVPGRWWLGSPRDSYGKEVNPDSLTKAQSLSLTTPLSITLQHEGVPLDFTFGAFEMPVLNYRTLKLLDEFAAGTFQSFSVCIENHVGNYAAVNFLQVRKCLDEIQSEFIKWTKKDHRADKAGQYRQVTKLRINPTLIGDCDVFRLWGWDTTLIVSERIHRAFIDHKISGVCFIEVG
jgi:hypothetical protein